ncbi:MAG TPA: squalene synthase [Ktedonobacter sp.]|nr:squalene synthase [Ktedonobacter sp.]
MYMRQDQVTQAYDYCRQVTRKASKTFYWGSIFLPQPKRQAIWAVYALCRVVDDIVDEIESTHTPRVGHLVGSLAPQRALDDWRNALQRLYQRGGCGDDPIQLAWSDMLSHYPIPLSPLMELLDGVEMDMMTNRYQNFDELYLYCYRVAGTVGLLTSSIFGYEDELALQHAVDLGVAMQLINILRDIGEDAQRNRIYLPLDEMKRFGYSEDDLMQGKINEPFRELVRFQMVRADSYYQRSQPGIQLLSADCRLAVRLSGTLYRLILDRIHLNNYNVFTKRASVPLKTKLATASRYWVMEQREMYARNLHGV